MKYWFSDGAGSATSLPVEVCQYLLERGITTYFDGGQFIGRNQYSDELRRSRELLPVELPTLVPPSANYPTDRQ